MRRIILVLAVAAVMAMVMMVGPAFADNEKETVCHNSAHNPHEINVSEKAVPAHLEHGDIPGACPDDDNDDGLD